MRWWCEVHLIDFRWHVTTAGETRVPTAISHYSYPHSTKRFHKFNVASETQTHCCADLLRHSWCGVIVNNQSTNQLDYIGLVT